MKRVISLVVVLAMVLAMPVLAMAEDSFGVGSAQDHSYWNDYLSIGCTLSDEWYFYTDEEIMENVQSTAGELKEDLAEAVKEAGTMMDMMAVNTETGETEFMGKTHACLTVSGSLQGIGLYETLVAVKSGRTMIVVTACSYWEDTTPDILASFYGEKP